MRGDQTGVSKILNNYENIARNRVSRLMKVEGLEDTKLH